MIDSPHGVEGTKQQILKLLVRQEFSAKSLAEAVGISPTAIRQHLQTLQALDLVKRRKIVLRPSRPIFLYRLSDQGARTFPKRYDLLLGLVVEVLLERSSPSAVEDIVGAAARRFAERTRGRHAGKILESLDTELAWQADVSGDAMGRRITIHQCPFQDLSRDHPSVCGVFFTTLLRALYAGANVEQAPTPPAPACCAFVLDR